MRTQDEIVEKVKTSKSLFGFDAQVLLQYVDFEHAKPFLEANVAAEQWTADGLGPKTEEQVLAEMKSYMEFGWGKVENHRGISAGRTIEKMEAWLWVLGKDELLAEVERMEDEQYKNYGAPILKRICEHFNWPVPQDERVQRMAEGLMCNDYCDEGCA